MLFLLALLLACISALLGCPPLLRPGIVFGISSQSPISKYGDIRSWGGPAAPGGAWASACKTLSFHFLVFFAAVVRTKELLSIA